MNPEFLPRLTFFGNAWGLLHTVFETRVSATPAPTFGHHITLSWSIEVGHDIAIVIAHNGAKWDFDFEIVGCRARFVARTTAFTIFGTEMHLSPKSTQRVDFRVRDQCYIATIATITAVGATMRHIFLAPKANHAVTARTTFDENAGFIQKLQAHVVLFSEFHTEKFYVKLQQPTHTLSPSHDTQGSLHRGCAPG